VWTDEFGGNFEGVIQIPSTSGTAVPAVVEYVAFTVPNERDGPTFSMGFDPHTVTAYVSPYTNKPLAVLTDGGLGYLAVVDLGRLLKAPRIGHTVNRSAAGGTRNVREVVTPAGRF